MGKMTFMGAGSTVFVRNICKDMMLTPCLRDWEVALYDIDAERLGDSQKILEQMNNQFNEGQMSFKPFLGVENRREALKGADFVVNAIQVGGYKPSTVIDFEIPKKYGLKQTIADTLGIGGIFRGLRTIPVMLDFARDMEDVCPNAWLLNYTNPMSILTGAMLRATNVKIVGLCHSVQVCAQGLVDSVGMKDDVKNLIWQIAGINHQGWLLEIRDGAKDLYPEIKRRALEKNLEARLSKDKDKKHGDMVRFEIMNQFGYYLTESSEHSSEYMPYWIKKQYPGLIDEFNIPIDEYITRCISQIEGWKKERAELLENKDTKRPERTHEYGSRIMASMVENKPLTIGGNVLNTGLIPNLPAKACVEVPCLVDSNGVQGCYVGDLPEQCAALNRTNINPQLLTIEAALEKKRDAIYHAAMLDPHTSAELTLDEIRSMCDELIEAHGDYLPKYK